MVEIGSCTQFALMSDHLINDNSDIRDYSSQTIVLFIKSALFDEEDFPNDVRGRIVMHRDVRGLISILSGASTLLIPNFLRRYLYIGADPATDDIHYYRAFRAIPYSLIH